MRLLRTLLGREGFHKVYPEGNLRRSRVLAHIMKSGRDMARATPNPTDPAGKPGTTWQERHFMALMEPKPGSRELAIVMMLMGAEVYAMAHGENYDSEIMDDGVLGEAWISIMQGIRDLLNGECGRLDCGNISGLIYEIAQAHGLDPAVGL